MNDRCLTTGESQINLPTSIELAESQVTTLMTPSGIPAFFAKSANANADSGVCSAGLMMIVQPAASAGPAFLVIIAKGKFQGVIAAQTPIGCFKTSMRLSDHVDEGMAPVTLLASSANHSINDAAYMTSPIASLMGLPCSLVIK